MPIARALAHVIIKKLVRTGISQGAIAASIRRAGYGYRTKDLISDIRRFSGRFLNQYYVEKLGPSGVVSPSLMGEADLKRAFRYQIFGESTLYDSYTDSYEFKKSSFYTDRLLSNEDWEEEFINKQKEKYQEEAREVVGFKVEAVEHNIELDY